MPFITIIYFLKLKKKKQKNTKKKIEIRKNYQLKKSIYDKWFWQAE